MPIARRSARLNRQAQAQPKQHPPSHTAPQQTPEQAFQNVQVAPSRDSIMTLQRTIGNHATYQLLQRAPDDDKDTSGGAPALEGKTGYIGMNPKAHMEANALKKRLGEDVMTSVNDPATEAEMSTDIGMLRWIMDKMGMSPVGSQFWGVFDALKQADPNVRDQLGAVMKMFWGAQKGKYRLERLVMSGHSNGVAMWGEHQEGGQTKSQILLDTDLKAVASLFPLARDQIQDVMFSACWSVVAVELVAKLFPNVLTIWSYTGSSPSIKTGSIWHILGWEKETRGDKELDKGDAKGKSALWVRGKGFLANDPGEFPPEQVHGAFDSRIDRLNAMLKGEEEIHRNFCNTFYTIVQVIKIHPRIEQDYKDKAKILIPKILRLRYWDLISSTFAKHYETEIDTMYTAISLDKKSLGSMNRVDLVGEVDRIEATFDEHTPENVRNFVLNVLKKGLVDLDETIIPNTWI